MITPIARVEGTVVEAGPEGVIVMTGGLGYGMHVPATALARLKVGGQACLHTYLVMKEDGASLYGFATAEERRTFATLLGVTRLGPKGALAVLSAMSPADLTRAIAVGDVDALRRLPGVGPKMAARMVLELRGSLDGTDVFAASLPDDDAAMALIALGYTPDEAVRALDGVEGATEERVRDALRRIAGGSPARGARS